MNQLGITLLWCVAQVTLLSLSACGAYVLLRRFGPRAGALVIMTSMTLIVGLSLMMFSPWPRWTPVADFHQGTSLRTPLDRSDSAALPGAETDQPVATSASTTAAEGQPELSPVDQSSAMLFLEALRSELSRPRPAAETTTRRWPAVLVALISGGMLLGLMRLLVGLVVVLRYRGQSRIIEDPRLREMADILLAELGCRRRPELRESDALVSAATVGWRRPLILLPRQWREWKEEQLRAVLAHELAHVQANDFLAGLLGQIGLALHFYHPLVHWLMGRLRLEQELAADSIAAALSGGCRTYLTTIAAMALEQEDHNVGWPARAFLPARSTFLRRISMLRNSRFRIAPVSTGVRATSIAVMLLVGLAVAGLRPPLTDRAMANEPDVAAADATEHTAGVELDLAYVPDDVLAVAAFRPAKIKARLEQLGLYDVVKDLIIIDEPLCFALFGVDIEGIEQFTEAICPGDRETGTGNTHLWVFRSLKPNRFDEVIGQPAVGAEKRTHQGKTYYICRGSFAGVCYRADDRTLVLVQSMGSVQSAQEESVVRRLIEAGPDPHPAVEQEEAWQTVNRCLGAGLLNGNAAYAAMAGELSQAQTSQMTPQEALLLSFLDFCEDVQGVSVGVRFDEELSVQAFASCKNEEAADNLKDMLAGFKVLGRTSLKAQSRSIGYNAALLDVANEFLDALEITKDGVQIKARTAIRADREWAETFAEEIVASRQAAKRTRSMRNLRQLALAMHHYHATHGTLPPPILLGPDGKTPYSWRVAILPYLGQQVLYDAYDLDEPWDGPNNRKLLDRMPPQFRHPTLPDDTTTSAYYVLTGPDTLFESTKEGESLSPKNQGMPFTEVRDGTSATIMLVEAKRGIPWTRPDDIPCDADHPIPELGGFFKGGFYAAICDGSTRFWPEDIDEELLRAMISKSDGQVIDFDALRTSVRRRLQQ